MSGLRNGILIAVITLLITHGFAWAAKVDSDLPKPDPKGYWRIMTQDEQTTTSMCIGSLSTPLCAIETYLAARLRADNNLLNFAKGLPNPVDSPPLQKFPLDTKKYRVRQSGFLTPVSHIDSISAKNKKRGEAYVILDERTCNASGRCSKPLPSTRIYFLYKYIIRMDGGIWHVIKARHLGDNVSLGRSRTHRHD